MFKASFYLGFNVAMLIISLIIMFIYLKKEKVNSLENRIYKMLIISNLVELIFEIGCHFGVQNPNNLFWILIMRGYIATIMIWVLIFNIYVLTVTTNRKEKRYFSLTSYISKIIKITLITGVLATTVIMLIPINIYWDGISAYTYGGSIDYILIPSGGVFLTSWIILCIINIQKIKKTPKQYIPIIACIIFLLAATLLQTLDRANLVISIMHAFVTLIMYHTIENPDVKLLEQLEIAKEQSDKANRAKTEFLSSMSHEIRTPLNAIVGFSDYIINAESLEEAKENAKDIVNASQTLLEIVNSILDISKIEAGKMEIVNTKYKAKETFESLAKLVTPKMNEKGLDFTYYIAPDIPNTLFGDAANIKKVVTNLLSNAYKYTEKGFVKYEVNCVNTNDLSKLIITVEDSGRGIKQDKIDKLFTKFQRLDEDKNTTIEGTGLGLAITKQLTELMGGKILVHTVYGQGSKFTIIITQKIETSVEVEPQETKQEVKKELDLTDKKILIVDDNELNLKVASKVLGKFNANKLTTITSGFECIDKIKANEKYDLILLDDMMPKMSGIETLKKLKEIANFNIPVVALTANAIAGMKEKYIKEGFSDYLAKPLEKDELIRVMNEFLFDYDKEPFEDTEILDIIEEELEEPIIQELSIPKESETQYLKEKGVDLEKALSLLEDMDTYNDTIKEFLSQAAEKWKKIKTYKENNDLENYEKEIQSLKKDAENLGFIDLEEYLARHELKANVKDPKYIETHFSELKKEYKKIIKIAEDYIELI